MSGIYFRYRKTEKIIDSSYHLKEREKCVSVSDWLIGDEVVVCFPDSHELIEKINKCRPSKFEFYASGGLLSVKCKVVRRTRSIIWKEVGAFSQLSTVDVVLEAVNGYWEDILLWTTIGVVPDWATGD